jgi:hypothetical protein
MPLLALVSLASQAPAHPRVEPGASRVMAYHPMLRASLERIAGGSRLWREALDHLAGSGRQVVVLTPDQVRYRTSSRVGATENFDANLLAETIPVVDSGTAVPLVVVVVNLPLLSRAHHAQPWSVATDLQEDLDRIVVHEVYGHAIPYLVAGDLSGRCSDAEAGQRPVDACAIQRENAVRAELQLGLRADAGLEGLKLHRRLTGWLTSRTALSR